MQALCEKLGYVKSGWIDNLDEGDPGIIYFKRLDFSKSGDKMRISLLLALLTFFAIGSTSTHALQAMLTLTSPVPFQVFQRQGSTGVIAISGQTSATGTIEARFNGGEWRSVGQIRGGAFSGVLADQPQGQGGVEVRVA